MSILEIQNTLKNLASKYIEAEDANDTASMDLILRQQRSLRATLIVTYNQQHTNSFMYENDHGNLAVESL